MDIVLKDKHPKKESLNDLQSKSEQQFKQLQNKYIKGCGKIYHEHGVYTAKGDALYDFTCNFSHRCQECKTIYYELLSQRSRRNDQKTKEENSKKVNIHRQVIKKIYFQGQSDCQCTKEQMCKQCFNKLQTTVTKLQKGCGATWVQQFGGMAAGPAWVTCQDNYFLCEKFDEQLAFINSVNKEYPHIKLNHLPEIQKMYWSLRNYPYYQGLL